ncbi:MAG: aconitate hydratase AcnA [Phycisphaerales bacterium]|nr:aconitate hydratase AcnA [Phycisphaerales bacterium]MCB9864652.1 aconitate hydratase AcnA [Phycisphaerales bacterium]
MSSDPFGAKKTLTTQAGEVAIYQLSKLIDDGMIGIKSLPFSIKVLLENALRHCGDGIVEKSDVEKIAAWNAEKPAEEELPFTPARVVLQDFTGVPAVVDLAAMRSAMVRLGGDPKKINPLVPVDLVIDHSVQVDKFGTADSLSLNEDIEFARNRERYEFLRWGQKAFDGFRVVPPATGIVHQVNLEYLAGVVLTKQINGETVAVPDTLVGTDSHTTMINGLGVLGWGVGGIEAEACMLGQPIYMLTPEVIGFKLNGRLPEGATATDLVLTVTQMLRKKGVVGKFVEFYGDGLAELGLADRATIANMAPEYGATMGFFPVDDETLKYLRRTGRTAKQVDLVEKYCKAQGLFRVNGMPDPIFTDTLSLELSTVEPSLAGPKRPQDRIRLSDMKPNFYNALSTVYNKSTPRQAKAIGRLESEGGHGDTATAVADPDTAQIAIDGKKATLHHGSVVIAAITSCTNTSNPSVMLAAGLVAKKANAKGLKVPPFVKTSLAPGSKVVTEYLKDAGLEKELEKLGFYTVGYGCTTCIGNSGPLPEPVAEGIKKTDLIAASVLSGNRNFEGRVHALVKANYLASPPLVVAFAIAGHTDIDMMNEPLGEGSDGKPVFLRDIWPSQQEIRDAVEKHITPQMFERQYGNVFNGNEKWNKIKVPEGADYEWNDESTYVQEPPFFIDLKPEVAPIQPIADARVLVMVGDSITTDHISPAGSIPPAGPAGQYLQSKGVQPKDFNSFGSRRGNDRVMTRGTFANVRLRNQLAPGTEGGYTRYLPTGEQMSIFDAAEKYKADGTPLIVLAGAEYGTGSSRDWAAKGAFLLGVKAVIAASYERIHRSNLVFMGVLPLQFKDGATRESLGLTGEESFTIEGLNDSLKPRQTVKVVAKHPTGGATKSFDAVVRIDTPVEIEYYRNGGILQTVLRKML